MEHFSRSWVSNQMKQFKIEVMLKMKRLKDASGIPATAVDVAGPAVSILTGDRNGGLVGIAAETMYRASWFASKTFTFPLKDWQPCQEGWLGTISLGKEYKHHRTRQRLCNVYFIAGRRNQT